ncbi:MAG: GerMN domain-containing protein [Syntrophomonadaceae bacterium]|nr:GerMN domain-containing protein [Syntrophomonadaceae bacterium]
MRRLFMALALMLLLSAIGCGTSGVKEEIQAWNDLIKTDMDQASEELAVNDLIKEPSSELSMEQVNVKLYFARKDGSGLEVEERKIVRVTGIARATMEELLKGPREEHLKSALPDKTHLLDINIKEDGQCIVNLTSQAQGISGVEEEKLAVYSIVNTLSQFSTVKGVSFMVDGELVDSIGGNISTAEPVAADYDLAE